MESKKEYSPGFADFDGPIEEYLIRMQLYSAAIKEVKTKLEILDEEFRCRYDHNPIHHIESRLKTPKSIVEKLRLRSKPLNMKTMVEELRDIAGIRVICNYLDDAYLIARLLTGQDDVNFIYCHDYIEHPKPNGYRSLHLVIEVPIYLADRVESVPCEVQIRTIAMDFWASLEHELKYKRRTEVSKELEERLRICAEAITEVDVEMQEIHREILERTEYK